MDTFISHSPAETEAFAESWGRTAQPGLVIALSGDLGAGKTVFVKGLARGLGISARIQSPTFALVNIHETGRLPLYHLDLYRLDTLEQIAAAGLEDYLHTAGITVIEWAERWFGNPPGSGRRTEDTGQRMEDRGQRSEVGTRSGTPGIQPPESRFTFHASPFTFPLPLCWVEIETVRDTERRISYEDIGA